MKEVRVKEVKFYCESCGEDLIEGWEHKKTGRVVCDFCVEKMEDFKDYEPMETRG